MVAVPWSPRPYQEEALRFLLERQHSGLILDPGLGKTSTYLAYFSVLKERKAAERMLVVAPMRVCQTVWTAEVKKWKDFEHLRVADLTEKTNKQREHMLERAYDIYVINPESAHKVYNPGMVKGMRAQSIENKWDIDMFLADESTRWADTSTMRFKLIKELLPKFPFRNIATGTVTPNGEHQFFGQVYILDLGAALGQYITHFRQMYMHPDPYIQYEYKMNPGAAERIYERVAHLLLRMRAKDHLAMPDLITNIIEVDLPPSARKQYDLFERHFLIKVLDETIPAFNRASLGVKCRQISNGFIYSQEQPGVGLPIHDAKLEALEELIAEMNGRPLLLMYEFIEDGKRIQAKFPFAVNITGSKDTMKTVNDFNAGKIPLLIGHPRSAGHGLNLQECCADICWYGVTWDYELWVQAIARVWRQGQPSPTVRNHVIVGRDTTDMGVIQGLTGKEANQDRVDQALINYARSRIG